MHDSLTIREVTDETGLQACHRLRHRVFVEEQQVDEAEEYDDLDPLCRHFLCYANRQPEPVGTARLWLPPEGHAKAQRVAVDAAWRGRGVGRALMLAVEHAAAEAEYEELTLGAQLTAIAFYRKLGYEPHGGEFLDAGIPHVMMRKQLGA